MFPVLSANTISTGYSLNNSLRFRASASAYLNRTFATPTSSTIWTWSAWVKRGGLTGTYRLFGASTTTYLTFNSSDQLNLTLIGTSAAPTTAVYRDPAAWYHIVYTQNGSAQTIYVNNTSVATGTTAASIFNTAIAHQIGSANTSNYLDGYLTEVNFVDGQALTPSSFGSTNTATGVWQPAQYTGTYGINGFYLPFKDNTGTSQNFILSSEDFSNATYWNNIVYPVTVTANSVTAPNGTTTADTLLGANGVLSLIFQVIPVATTGTGALTASIYAKAATGSEFTLNAYYESDVEQDTTFNLSTGVVVSGPGSITSVGNGWYRCSQQVPARVNAGANVQFRIWVNGRGSPTNQSLYFWGAQINTGSTVCPYFPSTPAARTSINNLGVDYSVATGGYNNWIPNNISVTAGTTYDSMTDVPTNTSATVANYATLNPLKSNSSTTTFSEANLKATFPSAGAGGTTLATFAVSSGKWYWEVTIGGTDGATQPKIGVLSPTVLTETSSSVDIATAGYAYSRNGTKWIVSVNSAYGSAFTTNDVIGFALDMNAGTLVCYLNNTSQGTLATGLSGLLSPAMTGYNGITLFANFGQRPFSYTPPTGFVALNTYNLPDSTIKKGNTVMDATLYTGNGSTQTIANAASFQPDLVWVKGRSGATDHAWYDSVRGVQKQLESNTTTGETTETTGLTAFGTSGFTVGALAQMNTSAATYVGWQWQAGQGSTSSNTSGTITSTVSVNATAGFSIVTYTGTGANATVGHGLGVAPKIVIVKNRGSLNWAVYHSNLTSAAYVLNLNQTTAETLSATVWNSTAPTSTVFSVGTAGVTNTSAATYVAYCWAEIAGFSKFGSYTGNGSTDGNFVYLGFRPKYILFKNTSIAEGWNVRDTSRDTYNASQYELYPNSSAAEGNASGRSPTTYLDILSNGFKLRSNNAELNNSTGTNVYIYAAFAENPFKNALAR
jgi:hypothetical protein